MTEDNITAFLVEILRVSVIFGAMNLPGSRQAPPLAKMGLVIFLAAGLYASSGEQRVHQLHSDGLFPVLAAALLSTVILSLAWNLLLEAYALAFHLIGIQSGLSYASVVDPVTNVDNNILTTLTQFTVLTAFLGVGIHLQFLDLAIRLESVLDRSALTSLNGVAELIKPILKLSFDFGARIALPATIVMVILDTLSAIAGRLVDRFQLSAILFPVKFAVVLWLAALSSGSLIDGGVQKAEQLLGVLLRIS